MCLFSKLINGSTDSTYFCHSVVCFKTFYASRVISALYRPLFEFCFQRIAEQNRIERYNDLLPVTTIALDKRYIEMKSYNVDFEYEIVFEDILIYVYRFTVK